MPELLFNALFLYALQSGPQLVDAKNNSTELAEAVSLFFLLELPQTRLLNNVCFCLTEENDSLLNFLGPSVCSRGVPGLTVT